MGESKKEESKKKRTHIFIKKDDFKIYQKLLKSHFFKGKKNIDLFTCATLIGKYEVKDKEKFNQSSDKRDYIRINDNRNNDALIFLKSLAISDFDKVNILMDEDNLFNICEEYANTGIKQLNAWYEDSNKDFYVHLSETLLKFYKENENILNLNNLNFIEDSKKEESKKEESKKEESKKEESKKEESKKEESKKEESKKKRTFIFIKKDDFKIYQKLLKSHFFKGKKNIDLFTCATLIGKYEVKDKEKFIEKPSNKRDYIRVNDNRNKDVMIFLKSLAISDFDKVNILMDEDNLFNICEEYANTGIKQLNAWYEDSNKDFYVHLSETLLKFYNENKNVFNLKNLN